MIPRWSRVLKNLDAIGFCFAQFCSMKQTYTQSSLTTCSDSSSSQLSSLLGSYLLSVMLQRQPLGEHHVPFESIGLFNEHIVGLNSTSNLEEELPAVWTSIKQLVRKPSLWFLCLTFGINQGGVSLTFSERLLPNWQSSTDNPISVLRSHNITCANLASIAPIPIHSNFMAWFCHCCRWNHICSWHWSLSG